MEELTMSIYSIGAMNQLGDALENAGFSADDVTKLKQFKNLTGLRDILYGKAEIKYLAHVIDCDAAPFIPDGSSVEEHKKGGLLRFDSGRIFLYQSEKQKKGRINGHDLRIELSGEPVMNANVLDRLLAHPELIPKQWKGKHISFWGTIYRDSDNDLFVRDLVWNGCSLKWEWGYRWFSGILNSKDFSAFALQVDF